MKIDLNKHIWEGWRVTDFINHLEPYIKYQSFSNKEELKKWCMDNQPYYKKYIPEVVEYFQKNLNIQ